MTVVLAGDCSLWVALGLEASAVGRPEWGRKRSSAWRLGWRQTEFSARLLFPSSAFTRKLHEQPSVPPAA